MRPDRLRELVKDEQIPPTHLPRTSSSDTLSLQLRAKVPECAQQCLETYIQEEFNCPCNGLAALCQRYSSRGYTLGELAYICLNQYCGRVTRKESVEEYDICNSVRGAVQATFSVLTIPPTTSSKSQPSTATTKTKSDSRSKKPQPASKSSEVTSRQPTTGSAAAKGTANPTAANPSKRPLSTVTSAAASSPSAQSNNLSTTAAVGIAVGVLAVTVLIVAAMYFFFCVRRRKSKDGESEKSSGSASRVLPQTSSRLTIRPAENPRPIARDTIQCWQQLANPAFNRASNHANTLPDFNQTYGSLRSPSTRVLPPPRTPVQARAVNAATATTIFEEEGEDEEDVPPVPVPAWKNLGLPSNPRANLQSPLIASPPQKAPSVSSPRQQASSEPEPLQHATPAPTTPQQALSGSTSEPVLNPKAKRLPPPLKIPGSEPGALILRAPSPVAVPPFLESKESLSVSERRGSTGSRSRSRDSSGSLLNYYASSEAGVVTPSVADYPVHMELEIPHRHVRPPQIAGPEPSPSKPIFKRNSGGSDTSFESMDFDEPTPPLEEDKRLTPVQESPASTEMLQTPPISDIRYPQIPRSANDRSPVNEPSFANFHFSPNAPKPWHGPQRTSLPGQRDRQDWPLPNNVFPERPIHIKNSHSGSTLAAKRRGDTAARDLELNLNKFGTTYNGAYVTNYNKPGVQHDSPLKGYERTRGRTPSQDSQWPERNSSHRNKALEPPTTSRRWDPKLTPERRGDDLYLQAGIATPMSAAFPSEGYGGR